MSQKQNPSHSRIGELWRRFGGLFGGDAVRRKFGDTPPPEWVGVVAQLTDYQLDRGMRRLLASGKGQVPSLPEFRRLCMLIADDELDPPDLPALAAPAWNGDDWDIRANKNLLSFIVHMLAAEPRKLGAPNSPEQASATKVLVSYKNAWAQDMREWEGTPIHAKQVEAWDGCMARAMTAITEAKKAA
jgi:hypothetical protein